MFSQHGERMMSHCLNFLITIGLIVDELITDVLSSVAKMLGSYNVYSHCMYMINHLHGVGVGFCDCMVSNLYSWYIKN